MPSAAMRRARSRYGSISDTLVQRPHHLVTGAISDIWSMSCSDPRPLSTVAVAPPRITIGCWAICAFFTAVMVLVTPGPAVTAQTPGRPVIRDAASAANAADRSSRTSTIARPACLAPCKMGEM
jgi:hypothetical protein